MNVNQKSEVIASIKRDLELAEEAGKAYYVRAGGNLKWLRKLYPKGADGTRLFETVCSKQFAIGLRTAQRYMQWHTDAAAASQAAKRELERQRKATSKTTSLVAGPKANQSQGKNVVDFPERATACNYDPERGDGTETEKELRASASQWQIEEALRLAEDFKLRKGPPEEITNKVIDQVNRVASAWSRLSDELSKRRNKAKSA